MKTFEDVAKEVLNGSMTHIYRSEGRTGEIDIRIASGGDAELSDFVAIDYSVYSDEDRKFLDSLSDWDVYTTRFFPAEDTAGKLAELIMLQA